jgi:hypothetical protein
VRKTDRNKWQKKRNEVKRPRKKSLVSENATKINHNSGYGNTSKISDNTIKQIPSENKFKNYARDKNEMSIGTRNINLDFQYNKFENERFNYPNKGSKQEQNSERLKGFGNIHNEQKNTEEMGSYGYEYSHHEEESQYNPSRLIRGKSKDECTQSRKTMEENIRGDVTRVGIQSEAVNLKKPNKKQKNRKINEIEIELRSNSYYEQKMLEKNKNEEEILKKEQVSRMSGNEEQSDMVFKNNSNDMLNELIKSEHGLKNEVLSKELKEHKIEEDLDLEIKDEELNDSQKLKQSTSVLLLKGENAKNLSKEHKLKIYKKVSKAVQDLIGDLKQYKARLSEYPSGMSYGFFYIIFCDKCYMKSFMDQFILMINNFFHYFFIFFSLKFEKKIKKYFENDL